MCLLSSTSSELQLHAFLNLSTAGEEFLEMHKTRDSSGRKCAFVISTVSEAIITAKPITASKLAQDTGADYALVDRLLKHVAIEFFVDEAGLDTYITNDTTRCIALPGAQGTIEDTFQIVRIVNAFRDFLRETNYVNPTEKDKSAWKYAYKTDQHFFEYVNSPGRERKVEAFRNHMKVGKHDVLLINVGGNGGHDLIGFHKVHPSMPGRLILQDLPTTIQSLDSAALAQHDIELIGHDFFTPQPIHGAKAYYLKMYLHDWPNPQCIQILSQLKHALKPGYSRILLIEIVVPEEKAGWFETIVDMLMMQVHSAQERRERAWIGLVDAVGGLRVRRVWDMGGTVEKVIEIEVA